MRVRIKVSKIQKQFGYQVRKLRQEKPWTQDECAEICGLNRSHMGEIERGEVDVRLSTIEIIAQALGTTVSSLFKDIATKTL